MAISKLILNGEVQMDVTSDTVTAGSMLSGTTATKNDGTKATGTIASKSSSNLTVSGATVTAPAGYYASAASKSVASGTAGTPTATKGSVSNHAVSVTPSVTNTTGYITGGTKTGTAVSVSASELVSGTYSVTSSGTKDVTNYASASVSEGQVGYPTATKGTVSNHSISVTPTVNISDSGYVDAGVLQGTAVSVSASELVSGTKSITENGTGIDVTNYASVDVDVPASSAIVTSRYILHYIELENGSSGYGTCKVTNNTTGEQKKFYSDVGAVLGFNGGDALEVYVSGKLGANIYYNDERVATSGQNSSLTYTLTAPSKNLALKYVRGNSTSTAYFNEDGSSYTPISVGTIEVNASTTSTSAVLISDSITIDTSSLSTSKMVYVKVRDKAGKRNGYFYGTDMWFLWNMNGTTDFYPAKQIYRYTSNTISAYAPGTSTFYGVYVTNIDSAGALTIYARYNSNYTLTIDGTYSIDIYTLEWPNNISPYD